MKKCLTCGKEYEDDAIFCPACGEKLIATNVCQKCGKPISSEDVYCKYCGHKIEKECRCEKCSAVIPNGAKFCPACGAEVINPVVSVIGKDKLAKNPNPKFSQILFYAVYGTGLLLLLLMLIGCFGDLSTTFTKSSSSASSVTSSVSISYFFGDAFKQFAETSKEMKFFGYNAFAISKIIFDYALWILAIVSSVLGLVFGTMRIVKAYKNKDFALNIDVILNAALGTIPYLAIVAFTNTMLLSGTDGAAKIEIGVGYGWGTMMIFVSLIVFFALLASAKLVHSIVEKTNILSNSIVCCLKIALFVLFIVSFGQVLSIIYNQTGINLTGYSTTYGDFTNYLKQYSAGTIVGEFPSYCVGLLVGLVLLLVGSLVGIPFFAKLFSGKSLIPLYILGGLIFVMLLVGYIISLVSMGDYIKALGYSYLGVVKDAFKISAIGIVYLVFIVLSLAGVTVAKKLEKVKE